eukprot:403374198
MAYRAPRRRFGIKKPRNFRSRHYRHDGGNEFEDHDKSKTQSSTFERLFNSTPPILSKGDQKKQSILNKKKQLAPVVVAKKLKTLKVVPIKTQSSSSQNYPSLIQIYQKLQNQQVNNKGGKKPTQHKGRNQIQNNDSVQIDTSTNKKISSMSKISKQVKTKDENDFCCLFCNNRKVLEATKKNDVHAVKKLLEDYQQITNPIQAHDCWNTDQNALKIADQMKHYEIVKLFVKEFNSKRTRKELPDIILGRYHTGYVGHYDFSHGIAEINQARGSKEGNDAFVMDNSLRTQPRVYRLLKDNMLSLQSIKLFIEDKSNKDNLEGQIHEKLTGSVVEYVRTGRVQEAHFLLKYNFENGLADLNRLFHLCLDQIPPINIVRISVTKQSKQFSMLSPLHCACINPNLKVLQSLIKVAPTFSLPDYNRRNLVHYAVANENPAVLGFLLANGCDPNELDNQRKTPLMIAAQLGKLHNIQVLLEHYDKKKKEREIAQTARDLLKKKKKVQAKPKKGKKKDDSEDEDMDEGSDEDEDQQININSLDMKDRSSWTALHFAAQQGHYRCVDALLKAGANPNLKNSKSMTPILLACAYGHLEVVKILDKNDVDYEGKIHKQKKSALIFACMNGSVDIVNLILSKKNLDLVNKGDTSKNNPIHYAVAYGWAKIVQILIDHGVEQDAKNLWNSTPASIALQKGHYRILKLLIQNNKDQNGTDQFTDDQGRDIIVQNLLNFGINSVSHFENLVKLFDTVSIKPNKVDLNGHNAFHYLAGINVMEIAKQEASKRQQDEDEMQQALGPAGKKSSHTDEEEDEDMENSDAEQNNGEEVISEKEKMKRKVQDIYRKLSEQIVILAEFLEHLQYNFTLLSNDGTSPLNIAMQQKNLPLNYVNLKSKRTFLHWFAKAIVQQDSVHEQHLNQIFQLLKQGHYNQNLKGLSILQDIRGFTPLIFGLQLSYFHIIQNNYSGTDRKLKIDSILQLLNFMLELNQQLLDNVPEERNSSKKSFSRNDQETIEIEKDKYETSRINKIRIICKDYYNEKSIDDIKEEKLFKNFGLIDHRIFRYNIGEMLTNSNWLHILTQLILLSKTNDDQFKLIDFVESLPLQKYIHLLIQKNVYAETPITLAMPCSRLLSIYMRYLDAAVLYSEITDLYRDGPSIYIHLLAYVKDHDIINLVLNKLKGSDILIQDEFGNTLLHYAAYNRNLVLVKEIINRKLQLNNNKVSNKLSHYTPLHLAVKSNYTHMELPELEELLLDNFPQMLKQVTKKNESVIELALKQGAERKIDPINIVKLLLDHMEKQKLSFYDNQENNILIIAARLDDIPLSLSLINQKLTVKERNHENMFGNNALSEAILNHKNQNALFLLQQGNIQIQQEFTKYSLILDKTNLVLTTQEDNKEKLSLEDYELKKENLQKIALQNNFFGLYHLNQNKNTAIDILYASLLCKNFTLFNQLLPNFSKQEVQKYQNQEGRSLMHALAQSLSYPEFKLKNKECEENQDEDQDEDEDMDEQNDNDQKGDRDSDEKILEQIFYTLLNNFKIDAFQPDKDRNTPILLALKSTNMKMIALIFQQLQLVQVNFAREGQLSDSNKTKNESFLNVLLSTKVGLNQQTQIALLKEIKAKLIPNIVDLILEDRNLPCIDDSDIQQYKKHPYSQAFEQFLGQPDTQFLKQRHQIVDLIKDKHYETIIYLITEATPKVLQNQYLRNYFVKLACLTKDIKLIRILHQRGHINFVPTKDEEKHKDQSALYLAISNHQQLGSNHILRNYVGLQYESDSKQQPQLLNKLIHNGKAKQNAKIVVAMVKDSLKDVEQEFQRIFKDDLKHTVKDDLDSIIDKQSEMSETHQIYESFNILLQKAEVHQGRHGVFRFYVMQLLKEKLNDRYVLWTRWGSIGDTGQHQRTPFAENKEAAIKEFQKVFKQKTGYDFQALIKVQEQQPHQAKKSNIIEQKKAKYRIIQLGNQNHTDTIKTQYKKFKNKIDPQFVKNKFSTILKEMDLKNRAVPEFFAFCILNVVINSDNNKERGYNAFLTQEHILEAQNILNKALDLAKLTNDEEMQKIQEQLLELSNQYYSLVPTSQQSYAEMKTLEAQYKIEREIEKLNEIYNFSTTFKLALVSLYQQQPIDYIRNTLPIRIYNLNQTDEENCMNQPFKTIMRYLNASKPFDNKDSDNRVSVSNIFGVDEQNVRTAEDDQIFNNLHNHTLLWHGTKNQNLIGILQKGMRLKPVGVRETGSIFGDGIYFADQAKKAIDYSSYGEEAVEGETKKFYLLLCEVALGNLSNFPTTWEDEIKRPPRGSHSVRIMSSHGPDFSFNHYEYECGLVPSGPVIKYPAPKIEQGNKVYKDITNFAEYLTEQIEKEKQTKNKQQNKGKKSKKAKKSRKDLQDSDEDMSSENEDEKVDETEEDFEKENMNESEEKLLEKSFLDIKERKFEIKPHKRR